jgi:hypothetical protein
MFLFGGAPFADVRPGRSVVAWLGFASLWLLSPAYEAERAYHLPSLNGEALMDMRRPDAAERTMSLRILHCGIV